MSRDLRFLTRASGSALPFLPFSNANERMQFSEYAKDNLGLADSTIATHWNRHIVDGKTLMPKLPVHIRTHRKNFDRSQHIRGMQEKTKGVRKQLSRINHITYASATSAKEPVVEGVTQILVQQSNAMNVSGATASNQIFLPIPMPPVFALPAVIALHDAPYSRVHTSTIAHLDEIIAKGNKRKVRNDKGKKKPNRKPRRCMVCVTNGGANVYTCRGKFPRGICQYF